MVPIVLPLAIVVNVANEVGHLILAAALAVDPTLIAEPLHNDLAHTRQIHGNIAAAEVPREQIDSSLQIVTEDFQLQAHFANQIPFCGYALSSARILVFSAVNCSSVISSVSRRFASSRSRATLVADVAGADTVAASSMLSK